MSSLPSSTPGRNHIDRPLPAKEQENTMESIATIRTEEALIREVSSILILEVMYTVHVGSTVYTKTSKVSLL